MITFEVHDMTCGHCVSSITKAVRAIDPGAQVSVDLATRRVRIGATESDTAALRDAIRGAGYTPAPVDDAAAPAQQPTPRSGCCCR